MFPLSVSNVHTHTHILYTYTFSGPSPHVVIIQVPGLIFYRVWVLILWPWFRSGPSDARGDEGKEGRKLRPRQHSKVRRSH